MVIRSFLAILGIVVLFSSIPTESPGQEVGEKPLFTRMSPEETGVTFSNYITETPQFNINVFIYAYNGGGVAAGDVNGDGLIDLYFSGTQAHSPNRLYINKGNMKFEDVSAKAGVDDSLGVRYGISMIDINGDGRLDLYVNKQYHPNQLYINNGNGTFTERAKEFGLDFCCSSTQTAFFDYDLDGDLDAYIGLNGAATGDDYTNRGLSDRFFRNNGDGTFTDITEEVGIHDEGYALSVVAGDVNNDGYPDVYITNDFVWRDILYINNGDGTFREATKDVMKHTTEFGMGSDMSDFNNDGLLDIVAVDMLPESHWRKMSHMGSQNSFSPLFDSTQMMRNNLQLNRGNGMFSEIAQLSGVDETDWSWSALFGDYDQDGNQDLFIANGYMRDVANRDVIKMVPRTAPISVLTKVPSIKLDNHAYRNNGDLTFTKVSKEWGLGDYVNSNGAIYADLDNDGDLDLIINNIAPDSAAYGTAMIYRNNANELKKGNWLQIKLEGKGKNTSGIGARVQIRYGDKMQIREHSPIRGYLSCTQDKLHFGLGDTKMIDRLLVTWPDGSAQVLEHIEANKVITLKQKDAAGGLDIASLRNVTTEYNGVQTFTELMPEETGLTFVHRENVFDDFNRERLLPNTLSRNGPGIAVGDIDGNGLDDVWIGGARESAGQIFLQTTSGSFHPSPDSTILDAARYSEDMGGIFFDADGDNDLDLYVASGGNEVEEGDSALQDRLYLNNGGGNFTIALDRLPNMRTSTSSVSACDYDGDGDLDLFVAGRCKPAEYPDRSRSYLLENRGGQFFDVTAEVVPELLTPGMITAAIWSDFNNDNRPDLVVTGEWLGVSFYKNENGKHLVDVSAQTGLDSINGWWRSLSSGDFDNDGDIDYVVGNVGLNTRQTMQPTKEYPIKLYANDFDRNSSRDLIMTYFFEGKEYPSRGKDALATQMGTFIKRNWPDYVPFSIATVDRIFDPALLASAEQRFATTMYSAYIENLGDGTFTLHRLPTIAQASPISGIAVNDFNADGNLDLLALENFYGPDREVIRYDAGFGLLLNGNGKGGFASVPVTESGFFTPHDGRSLTLLDVGSDTTIYALAVNNNAKAQVFRHNYGPYDGRLIRLKPTEHYTHAIIEFEDGRTRKHEFQLGSGYLSQTSRTLLVTPDMKTITFYNGTKKGKDALFIDEKMFGAR
ncbi:MAG: VCBS repeat-containing protein [Ignavibacteriae bacterium]|nr:VCBS repeat-containing protein [Ignavibacteriota bacterium]MCB9215330.1 VCBS repeat-containing protein [Ignavibacteria bacterium]